MVGDPLGGEEETIRSPFNGIVIGRSNLPLAHEGGRTLFNVAAFKSVARVETGVETFAVYARRRAARVRCLLDAATASNRAGAYYRLPKDGI